MAEEIASLVACSNAANRDAILDGLKKRTRTCANAWKSIEENIDESINLLEKENKRFQKGFSKFISCFLNLSIALRAFDLKKKKSMRTLSVQCKL